MIHFCQDEANAIIAVWQNLIGSGNYIKVVAKNTFTKIKCKCCKK